MPDPTVPLPSTSVPLVGLAAEVVEGPDLGKRVTASGDRISVGTAEGNDLVLTDPTVSRFHLDLVRRGERIQVIDQGSTNGTGIAGGLLQADGVYLKAGTVLGVGRSRLKVEDAATLSLEAHPGGLLAGLVGKSAAMRQVMARVARVAPGEAPVLVLGESGTGKERIAAAIHELGKRRTRPFVTVDCGALAPTLVASELFGHEKGAFTGADRRRAGSFERADGGTLFLDEIGELPAEVQTTLLGVLERKRFRRVGGNEEVPADVRVVAATHRDLKQEVNRGAFRLDLYYRLAVVVIRVPPLRERPEDIPELVKHFLDEAGWEGASAEVFPETTLAALAGHAWPGNVRELRNVVEATLALGEPPIDLPSPAPGGETAAPPSYREAQRRVLDEFERRFLTELLARTGGNVSQAAREARMNRSHLIELLKRHGLK